MLALAAAGLLCACNEPCSKDSSPKASSLSAPESPRFGKSCNGGQALSGSPSARAAYSAESIGEPEGFSSALFDGSRRTGGAGPQAGAGPIVASFQRRISDPTPVQVQRSADGALTYVSGMTIDTDGRVNDPAERSAIQRQDRHHRDETSLRYADGGSVDPTRIPYIVLPLGFEAANTGDLAMVEYGGRRVYAVVGDRGPRGSLGEASVAVARALGIDADGGKGGVESGVRYTVFPGTGAAHPRDESELLSLISTRSGTQLAASGANPDRG